MHTKKTIEALKANELAGNSDLFIFSDAPRKEQDNQAVKEVRNYIEKINGFKRIEIMKRQKNYGVSKNIINGVNGIINKYDRVIVLEDDLIPSQYFLRYMNDSLELYEDEERVMQISGYMFPVKLRYEESDALFLPLTTSWGWGTWKRAWNYFDPAMNGFDLINNNKNEKKTFNLYGAYDYFNLLMLQKIGKIDSWAIRWYLNVFLENGLVLFPKRSLIYNTGFDGSGVHCRNIVYGQQGIDAFRVTTYPKRIEESANKYIIFRSIKRQVGIIKRIRMKLYEYIKKIV